VEGDMVELSQIDLPDVRAEVQAVFEAYEAALVSNDVPALEGLFWNDERTVRYGAGENLYGSAEISAFRKARPASGLNRKLSKTVITTYGRDFATAVTLFTRDASPGRVGRQMQTWVRFGDGWKIVAAHVSDIAILSEEIPKHD
jgi:hypothetical protein